MGLFQAQVLVEFEVLLYMQLSQKVLHADVMHVEVVAGGNGAYAVENIFRAQLAGTECTTTSASGNTSCTASATAVAICSERWKVTLRATPTERSAK